MRRCHPKTIESAKFLFHQATPTPHRPFTKSMHQIHADHPIQNPIRRWMGVSTLATSITILAAILMAAIPISQASSPLTRNGMRCQYSVRDVAFVNLNGSPWQIQLIKPIGDQAPQLKTWSKTLTQELADSNVSHVWFSADSIQAKRIFDHSKSNAPAARKRTTPQMIMTGPHDQIISFPESNRNLADQLKRLTTSPARREIIDHVVDSLCVFVLIESGDPKLDSATHQTVTQAIEQVNRQMWTLEKPTDQGPVLVTIPHATLTDESWLLASLGIENTTTPSVAIVYGQGRRLGEVLTADAITVKNLVARASICGQDCECSLDRDWLYGRQVIHTWDASHELAAESSLTFDPHSAFVMAEVSQIVQKNSGQKSGTGRVLLGGGLVIHDLDPIQPAVTEPPTVSNQPPTDSKITTEATITNSILDSDFKPNAERTANPTPDAQPQDSPSKIPWPLIAGLSIAMIGVFAWRKFYSR